MTARKIKFELGKPSFEQIHKCDKKVKTQVCFVCNATQLGIKSQKNTTLL